MKAYHILYKTHGRHLFCDIIMLLIRWFHIGPVIWPRTVVLGFEQCVERIYLKVLTKVRLPSCVWF